ncbi:MAG: hypothetical protein ACJ8F7_18425 [Gemmataceae bacterium]
MPFILAAFEAFMVKVAESIGASPAEGLALETVATALDLPLEQCKAFAGMAHKEGLANIAFNQGNGHILSLTLKGYEFVEGCGRPKWQRWIDRHPILVGSVIVNSLTGLLYSILAGIILYFLLKPADAPTPPPPTPTQQSPVTK